MRNAAERGIDVRIMLPQRSDVRAVYWASRALYAPLLRGGVKIFEWTPTILHAKTVCVDGIWSSVGSYNLDWRSFLYNWELSLAIVDLPTAAALQKRAEPGDILVSAEVTAAALTELGGVAALPEPVAGTSAFSWRAAQPPLSSS